MADRRTIQINFDGWFQCRLATNPDPADEPRGVSGYTFALSGEPDLDRVIRLQNPVLPRSHAPHVGVHVRGVVRDGEQISEHPLLGARVSLLDQPKFESRNLLVTQDRAGIGLIHPFHLEIAGSDVVIRRKDLLDPEGHHRSLHEIPPTLLHRRAPTALNGMIRDTVRIAEATGISDAAAYRRQRRELLASDMRTESDPVQQAALKKRIDELSIAEPNDNRLVSMEVYQSRSFEINGPVEFVAGDGVMEDEVDDDAYWPIEFWMGGWDADALSGYMSGIVSIPLKEGAIPN